MQSPGPGLTLWHGGQRVRLPVPCVCPFALALSNPAFSRTLGAFCKGDTTQAKASSVGPSAGFVSV